MQKASIYEACDAIILKCATLKAVTGEDLVLLPSTRQQMQQIIFEEILDSVDKLMDEFGPIDEASEDLGVLGDSESSPLRTEAGNTDALNRVLDSADQILRRMDRMIERFDKND